MEKTKSKDVMLLEVNILNVFMTFDQGENSLKEIKAQIKEKDS